VLVVLVDLHPQRGQLGKDDVGQAGGHEELQRGPRRVLQQRLGEFSLHALRGDPRELAGQRRHRRDHVVVRGQPELGDEPDGAQHPQRVVGEGVHRGTGRAQPAGQQVAEAAEGVGHRPVRAERHRHRVHGEVAAHEIVDQGGAPGHLGVPGLPVVPVGAEGGDLQPDTSHLGPDGAERDAGVPRGTGPPAQQVEHLLRPGVRRDVEVARHPRAPRARGEQRVPDRAADEVRLEPGGGEPRTQLGQHRREVDECPHRLLHRRRNRLGATRWGCGHDEPG
jgi:hypothetical protein